MNAWLSKVTPRAIVLYACAIGIVCLWILLVVAIILAIIGAF